MANLSVPNQRFTCHKGVKVYHLHRDERRDECVLSYHYTVRAYGSFDDNGTFDVRDLKAYRSDLTHKAIIWAAIDAREIAVD